jgi:hypothetical protein
MSAVITPLRNAPYVPPPADVEPLEADDPMDGMGAVAWSVGILVVTIAFGLGFLLAWALR